MTCKCFTCTHKDPRLKKAYCIGYMEACEWFLNWAKEQGIKMGSISDNDLGGIYAQINCNYEETGCYARDLPDIDEVPRKTTGKIELLKVGNTDMQLSSSMFRNQFVADTIMQKINELVNYVNALIESNNIHEKQIDKLQMKLEPEKCAVNELKGANQ